MKRQVLFPEFSHGRNGRPLGESGGTSLNDGGMIDFEGLREQRAGSLLPCAKLRGTSPDKGISALGPDNPIR